MVYGVYMMIRTQIMFPEEMLTQLRAQAISQQTSVSDVVRKRIVPIIKKKMSGWEMLRKLAKDAKKNKKYNLPKDFASNDKYLYDLP